MILSKSESLRPVPESSRNLRRSAPRRPTAAPVVLIRFERLGSGRVTLCGTGTASLGLSPLPEPVVTASAIYTRIGPPCWLGWPGPPCRSLDGGFAESQLQSRRDGSSGRRRHRAILTRTAGLEELRPLPLWQQVAARAQATSESRRKASKLPGYAGSTNSGPRGADP